MAGEAATVPDQPEEHGDRREVHPHLITRRWKRILAIGLAVILLVIAAIAVFVGTQSGSNFVRDTVNSQNFGETLDIQVGDIEGSVYGTPVFTDVVIRTYRELPEGTQYDPDAPETRDPQLHIVIDRMRADADLLLYLRTSLPDVVIGGLDTRVARLLGVADRRSTAELRLRLVDIERGSLKSWPEPREEETDEPLLPEMPITIERLKVANFTIESGVLTEESYQVALDSRVQLREGRAVIDGTGAVGPDTFAVRLNAAPDAAQPELDLYLDLDASDGGPLTALAGLDGSYRAQIKGAGNWNRWNGHALASRSGERIGAFELGKAGDRVRIAGIADPSSFLEGLPRDALGERVSLLVDGDLTFDQIANAQACGETAARSVATGGEACQRFDGLVSIVGRDVRARGDGGFDITNLRFQGMEVAGRLLDDGLLGDTATIEGLTVDALVDGTLDELAVRHTIEAQRIAAGAVELRDIRQQGLARYDGERFVLPLDGEVGRILTGNEMADPRLVNGSIDGRLVYAGNSLTSDALSVAFPGATARLSLDANLATQSIRLRGPAAINRVPIETLGIVNGGGRIDFAYNAGGWTLDSDFNAAVPQVTNDTIANLAGPRLDVAGGISLSSTGPITFRQVRLNSQQLQLTLDGRVDEGSTSVAGSGRHTQYGPFTVEAMITGRGPEAVLVFADPLPAAGLRDVRVALSPTEEGFAIETAGQSMLGAFEGNIGLVSPASGPTVISIDRLTVSETEVQGDLRLLDGAVEGRLALAGGGLDGFVELSPRGAGQGFAVDLQANDARFGGATPLVIARASLQGSGVFAGDIADSGTTAEATLTGSGISYGSLFIGRLAANAQLQNGMGDITASVTGRRDSRFALQLNGKIAPDRIAVAARGEYAGERISMPRRAVLVPEAGGWTLQPTQVNFAGGSTLVEGTFGSERTRLDLALDGMPLSIADVAVADLGLGGTISGRVTYDAPVGGLPSGEARIKVDDLTRSGLVLASRPIDLALVGRLTGERMEARAVLDDDGGQRGRIQMLVDDLPSAGSLVERLQAGDLIAQLRYRGPSSSLWRLAAIDAFDFTGPVSVAADIRGTLANPRLSGSLASDSLRVQSALSGTDIRDVSVRGNFAGSRLRITRFAGTSRNGGAISGSGFIDLANLGGGRGPEIDLRAAARNAQLLNARGLSATVTGPLRIVSDGVGGTIAGRLTVNRASWQFGAADETVELPNIETREINLPFDIAPPAAPGAPWRYLIDAVAPSRVDVDGMGLDSEWSADIRLRGTTDDPRIGGEARVVRGFYSFAGTRFELTRGRIEFDQNAPIDPRIDILAETEDNGINVEVSVQGSGTQPEISFSSTPALPEEEILARLLFGGSITDLSATDAVQLGAALASLRGGGGVDPINKLRTAIGLDRLRIVGADPALDRGTGVALGKNFGRRFYVELITDGRGYTATELEFRVTSWLSLLSAISSVGRESIVAEISRDY